MTEVYKMKCNMWKVNKKWILAVSYNLTGSSYFFNDKAVNLKTKGSWLSKNINQIQVMLDLYAGSSWAGCSGDSLQSKRSLHWLLRTGRICQGKDYTRTFISYVHVSSFAKTLLWAGVRSGIWNRKKHDLIQQLLPCYISSCRYPEQWAQTKHVSCMMPWVPDGEGLVLHVGNTSGNSTVNKVSMSLVRDLTWNEVLT